MTFLVMIFGTLLILSALVDVFQTLFHPASHGAISDWIAGRIWRSSRKLARHYPKMLTLAGPFALIFIIADWIVLTILGFGLLYWSHIGRATLSLSYFWISIANSLEVLSTISQGSNPDLAWIHIIGGFEAIFGFGIVTASVSWLLSIYPIIESRRSLAHKATLLHDSERKAGLDVLHDNAGDAPAILLSIANDLSVLRNQMAQFPISYYFYVGEEITTLARILPYVANLANRTSQNGEPQHLKIPGSILGAAVNDFSILLARSFLHLTNKSELEILLAYAHEQMCEPVSLV